MVLSGLPYLLTLLVLWHSVKVSQPKEVCCCPDLTLALSATESDKTKSLQNGFMFVAKRGSTVSLKCELTDKDHEAVQSVVYKFHKTYELSTTKPISLDSKKKELCGTDTSVNTCDLPNVQYTDNPQMSNNMDTADNQIYQCSAEITLVDGGVVMLWSHTIKLDVYYPPVKSSDPITLDSSTVSTGKALEKLICTIPDSNPKTKARWKFKKKGTDTWEMIDIPKDTVRGDRLAIAEDQIALLSQDDIKLGMLLIMIFNPDEDQGDYDCEGVYDTVFDEDDTSFLISQYRLETNNQADSGSLLLRPVSEITYPKLVNQDSIVNFTVYARDTPGRGEFGDVTYTWQIKGDPDVDVNFDEYPDLRLSNHDRTLTVSNLAKHQGHEFHCMISRTKDGNTETIKTDKLGVKTSAVIIAPKKLTIPLTSRTCVNFGSNLKAVPNKSYMMPNIDLAGPDPEQILLKADSWKFYINDYKVMFITDNDDNFDTDTEAGVSQEQFAKKLDSNKNSRCVYWQYLRGYRLQYQVIEVMKTERLQKNGEINGCDAVDLKQLNSTKFKIEKNEAESKVSVTVEDGTPIPTAQCLKMSLSDSKDTTLDSKELSKTADSCASRTFPATVELKAETGEMDGLKIKICSETSPTSDDCLTLSVDPRKCSRPKDVPNVASIAPTSSEIEIGNKYTIKCSPNFVIEPSQAELLCQEDGALSSSAECVPGTCSKPTLTDNIESISPDMDSVNAGEKFTVKCKPNYVPENSELICQTDGSVSSLNHLPKCVTGTCSKPALTDNVESISPDNVKAGEKFTVKCKSNHVPEHSVLICQTDGSVSSVDHRDPKCTEVLDDDGESVTKDTDKKDTNTEDDSDTVTIVVVVVVVVVVIVLLVLGLAYRHLYLPRRNKSGKFKIEKIESESKVIVTIEDGIPTAQYLKMSLSDSKDTTLDSKEPSKTADSGLIPVTWKVELKAKTGEMKNQQIKICSESSENSGGDTVDSVLFNIEKNEAESKFTVTIEHEPQIKTAQYLKMFLRDSKDATSDSKGATLTLPATVDFKMGTSKMGDLKVNICSESLPNSDNDTIV